MRGQGRSLLGGSAFGRLLTQRAAVGDPTLGEVVRREGDGYRVARQDADEVLANLARDVGDDLVAVLQPDLELRVGQRGRHLTLNEKRFFLRHKRSLWVCRAGRPLPAARPRSVNRPGHRAPAAPPTPRRGWQGRRATRTVFCILPE